MLRTSVIVPSLERPALFKNLLDFLLQQTMRPYEVIMVNHSFDRKLEVYEDIVKQYRRVIRINHVMNHSSSLARSYNLGIRASRGNIVLFLDDDVILDRNLIEEHTKTYIKDPRVCGVQGSVIDIQEEDLEPPLWKRRYPWRRPFSGLEKYAFALTRTFRDIYLGKGDETLLRSGGNMSIRKSIISNFLVDENNVKCLGFEIELTLKILNANPQCVFKYNREARVYHIKYPRGASRPWDFKSAYNYGKAILHNVFKFKNYLKPKGININIVLEELFRTAYCIKRANTKPLALILGERLGATVGLGCSLIKNIARGYEQEYVSFKAITLTFDDGYLSVYEKALPTLETYDLKGVVFLISRLISGFFEGQRLLNLKHLKELIRKEWEVASHTRTHRKLIHLPTKEKIIEITRSKDDLERKLSINVQTFAYPYGAYDHASMFIASKFYMFARTVQPGINYLSSWIGYNRYALKGTIVREENIREVKNKIKKVKDNGGWLILVFHNIVDNVQEIPPDNIKRCWITYRKFKEIIETIVRLDIPVKTFNEIIFKKT